MELMDADPSIRLDGKPLISREVTGLRPEVNLLNPTDAASHDEEHRPRSTVHHGA